MWLQKAQELYFRAGNFDWEGDLSKEKQVRQ